MRIISKAAKYNQPTILLSYNPKNLNSDNYLSVRKPFERSSNRIPTQYEYGKSH